MLHIDPLLARSASVHVRALCGFARLMAAGRPGTAQLSALPNIHPNAGVIGGWAIYVDTAAPGDQHFGQSGTCRRMNRCVGCEAICRSEQHLSRLSQSTGGLGVLWVDIDDGDYVPRVLRVQTFVPSLPWQSGIWSPMWCAASHQLLLVSWDTLEVAIASLAGHLHFQRSGAMPGQGANRPRFQERQDYDRCEVSQPQEWLLADALLGPRGRF